MFDWHRSHKTKNDYENEQYKHHPSPAIDQRSISEVFSQITFKEHIPCTGIGGAQSKQAVKSNKKGRS